MSRPVAIAILGVVLYGIVLVSFLARTDPWPERLALFLLLVLPCALGGVSIVLSEGGNLRRPRQAGREGCPSGLLLTSCLVIYFILRATEAIHRNMPRLH